MRIWYQSFGSLGHDPKWNYYEQALKKHIIKVARPNTVVDVHGVEKGHPRFSQYYYFMSLHLPQVINNALHAEQDGYDAFIAGGMLDPGYFELKEVTEIPVAFLAESSFHIACLLAHKFTIIGIRDEVMLPKFQNVIKRYGLEQRWVPPTYLSALSLTELIDGFTSNPERVIDLVSEAAKKPIEQGAGILIPASGTLSAFFADRGVTEINGVPILDSVRVVVEIAELLVDLKVSGINRSKKGLYGAPSKEELTAARKIYGVN